jgi:beta-glucosidase
MQGRTYRYFKGQPLYPFGFGLSYTRFAYSDLRLAPTLHSGEALKLSFTLKNLGEVSGQEVVQVYLSDLEASVEVPLHSLVGFKRLELAAGESRQIEFSLAPEQMMIFNHQGQQVLEPGRFAVEVGGCSPGKRGRELGACEPLSAEFSVIQ